MDLQNIQQPQHSRSKSAYNGNIYLTQPKILQTKFRGPNKNNLTMNEGQYPIQQDQNLSVDLKYDPKSYPEILDTYSLHHFIIRKGQVLEETPEYISYKRTYQSMFGKIGIIIRELERFAQEHDLRLFYVDGKKIALLSEKLKRPSQDELLDCIVDNEEILKNLNIPSRKFRGERGRVLAAIKIQSYIRMFVRYREYQRVKFMI